MKRPPPPWFCATPDCGQVLTLRACGSGKQPRLCADCLRERLVARRQLRRSRPPVDRATPRECACGAVYTLAKAGAVPRCCPACAENPHQRWRAS